MADKIIVSNKEALKGKYGAQGFAALKRAVDDLIGADKARGLETKLVFIDDAAAMQKIGGGVPIGVKDERGAKRSVDAVAAKFTPDYIVLLDGPDVVPHILLDNPLPYDGDSGIESDLPFASSSGFSRQVTRYLKVTRVVGRIPNVPGATKPDKLISFLETATKAKPVKAEGYRDYFGISADVWQQSTRMSLDETFGGYADLLLAPPTGPTSRNGRLAKLSHFINCHGQTYSPEFYGEKSGSYPVAMHSDQVTADAAPGTVVAAECCYGAELYDPALGNLPDPICISYLAKGALGFLGSTNIAYGPADANGQADLMTQYFFERVLAGASLGRALLQARQRFIATQRMTDPANLKTLAQFILLGDPATQPCLIPKGRSPSRGIADIDEVEDWTAQRKMRRATLATLGAAIPSGKAIPSGPGSVDQSVSDRVREIAKTRGFVDPSEAVLAVKWPADYHGPAKLRSDSENVVVLSERFGATDQVVSIRHLVAYIVGDGIASISETMSR
jgi:Peptidase family C25